jgi:hypothetical protein
MTGGENKLPFRQFCSSFNEPRGKSLLDPCLNSFNLTRSIVPGTPAVWFSFPHKNRSRGGCPGLCFSYPHDTDREIGGSEQRNNKPRLGEAGGLRWA